MGTTFWIVALVAGAVALKFLADGLFWCFAWAFCKVDGYFRERYMRMIFENLDRLDRIAAEGDKEREAA